MSEQKKWETRPNNGSAFINKRKQKDTHPDYTGELLVVDPGLHWLDIWVKETKDGAPWFSVSIRPKEDRGAGTTKQFEIKPVPVAAAPAPTAAAADDDSIPF